MRPLRWISTGVPANNFYSVSPIKGHRKLKMNIFLFRWYLVFLIFWIRGLGRSEHASVTLDLLCVSNAQGTPLIDDNVTNLCYYTMYNRGQEGLLFTLWV